MAIQLFPKAKQASGAFNGGEIVENKPVGFPQEGGDLRPYSNLFYWAHARAVTDSTIGLHPHQGFEICSFVLRGNIRHYDSKLREWRPLSAGDVQIIRAGNGISHAEFMAEGSEMFQIWFDPNLATSLSKPASYDDYRAADFPKTEAAGIGTTTLVGPGSPFQMDTPSVQVQRLEMAAGSRVELPADVGKIYSAYVLSGQVSLNGEAAGESDFALLRDVQNLDFQAETAAEIFLMENLASAGYPTYASRMRG